MANGKPMEFFGTNPVDHLQLLSTATRHTGWPPAFRGRAALRLFDKEYAYWKKNYPDISEYMARMSIRHDRRPRTPRQTHKTALPARLQSRRRIQPDRDRRIGELSRLPRRQYVGKPPVPEAGCDRLPRRQGKTAHRGRARRACAVVPMPDKAGRTQNCQVCHPSHWQEEQ